MEREVPQGQIIPNCSPKRVRPGHLETRTPAGLVRHGVCVGGVSNANTGNRDPIPVTKPNDVQDEKEPPAQETPWPDRRGQGADLPPPKHWCTGGLQTTAVAGGWQARGVTFAVKSISRHLKHT